MGDAISEGTVVEWRKAVGDQVAEDEVIAVVDTDKVSVDIRSAHVGVVVKLFAAVDDVVRARVKLLQHHGHDASFGVPLLFKSQARCYYLVRFVFAEGVTCVGYLRQ